jgi:hypothetical protein
VDTFVTISIKVERIWLTSRIEANRHPILTEGCIFNGGLSLVLVRPYHGYEASQPISD